MILKALYTGENIHGLHFIDWLDQLNVLLLSAAIKIEMTRYFGMIAFPMYYQNVKMSLDTVTFELTLASAVIP